MADAGRKTARIGDKSLLINGGFTGRPPCPEESVALWSGELNWTNRGFATAAALRTRTDIGDVFHEIAYGGTVIDAPKLLR
jgi:hypothetical protein